VASFVVVMKSRNEKEKNLLDSTAFMSMVKKDYKQIKHIRIFQVENRP